MAKKETKEIKQKELIKAAIKETGTKLCTGGCDHPKCGSGAIYGLGLIGAAVYYISTATTFWGGVLGFLKAILWPAFLTFEMMKYLGM